MARSSRELPLCELEREICELGAHIAAATCRWLLLLAEFDRRRGWFAWGIRSCAHWLSWRCSIGLRTAHEHVRVAHRLAELPRLREAFAAGQLSYCKVRAITRIATRQSERQLVELARHATGAQLENVVRGYRGAVAACSEQSQRQYRGRYLTAAWEVDGSLQLRGKLPPEQGAVLLHALEVAQQMLSAQPSGDAGQEAPTRSTRDASVQVTSQCSAEHSDAEWPVAARRADALTLLARRAVETGLRGAEGPEQVELVVHVDVETLAGDSIVERSEMDGGPALAPETVRRLGCDAAVERILERDGQPLSVGRRKRTIPPALTRALRARDRGCRFPGCTHTKFLHAHHIRHWARGGPTDLDNLVQLCSYHHRLVHEGGFQVERAVRRGIRFRRPDGGEVPHSPAEVTGSATTLRREQRRLGITVDTCRPLSAGDRIDYDLAVCCLLDRAGVEWLPRGP